MKHQTLLVLLALLCMPGIHASRIKPTDRLIDLDKQLGTLADIATKNAQAAEQKRLEEEKKRQEEQRIAQEEEKARRDHALRSL